MYDLSEGYSIHINRCIAEFVLQVFIRGPFSSMHAFGIITRLALTFEIPRAFIVCFYSNTNISQDPGLLFDITVYVLSYVANVIPILLHPRSNIHRRHLG